MHIMYENISWQKDDNLANIVKKNEQAGAELGQAQLKL